MMATTDTLSTSIAPSAAISEVLATTTTTPTVQPKKPPKTTLRIHVNTFNQPRPVVFNYRQLYKRELKKLETPTTIAPVTFTDSTEDAFYKELLKRAEGYSIDDEDDDNDDEDDDDDDTPALRKQDNSNEYDYEDPFIDDSEMLLDKPYEYSAPEFDGFFVYYGPLDGHETEKKASTQKRKSTATATAAAATTTATSTTTSTTKSTKSSTSSSATTANKKTINTATADKTRKKASTESESNKKKSTTTAGTTTTSAKSKATTGTATTKKPTTINKQVKKKKPEPTTLTIGTTSTAAAATTATTEQPTIQSAASSTAIEKTISTVSSPASSVTTINKKKPTIPAVLKPLDPEIELLMKKLRHDVQFEKFENKAKFPLTLKPTVLEIGLIAFRKYKVIDDNLVYHLMSILPYNRFTLKKFLTTKSGQMRVDELQQEIDELAILLKQTIDRMMPEQQRLFNEKLASTETTEDEESTPTPRFKCNDEVRKILYDIIQTEEQSIHIANQVALHKDPEKKPESLASDGKARKLMYQRLLSCWPEGWMHTYEMSRQYSQYKSKLASLSDKKIPIIDKKRKKALDESNTTRNNKKAKESLESTSSPVFQTPPPQPTATKSIPVNVITIDTDEEEDPPIEANHKQASSMSIESLIEKK
ncbi:uncharacterized protein BX663DRAFT_547137 [Cokeromyces recurvatus]|uniref:uncharacterized protein n=1 Tax=Cokeromyces recurvatus TaxID=90255 RepID=UPI00221E5C8E|nr:uncharacterized protein BX663DRAFT_547137 [Cokeromyces recurvatus]KAI7897492.1 hypothetical protein BX663DRAFT_547137 [Cokeromyces recurvatus]